MQEYDETGGAARNRARSPKVTDWRHVPIVQLIESAERRGQLSEGFKEFLAELAEAPWQPGRYAGLEPWNPKLYGPPPPGARVIATGEGEP